MRPAPPMLMSGIGGGREQNAIAMRGRGRGEIVAPRQ